MTYSKLGNIKGPQGRRGLNMTGGATTPPAVDESTLEGDLWLDSTTGDVYRASTPDPWKKDGTWNTWGTVLWKVADNTLMVQPAEGDTGTTGEPVSAYYDQYAPWGLTENNPSVKSMTSVRSKGAIAMNANSRGMFSGCTSLTDLSHISNWDVSGVTDMLDMFSGCTSLTDLSPLSGWDVSGVTNMRYMFYNCTSLTDLSPISNWNVSNVTNMEYMFKNCPLERIGIPSLAHGGKNLVSNFKEANIVTDMDATMLTNTTTSDTMSANQIVADMDSTPSKYTTGTVWTIARA